MRFENYAKVVQNLKLTSTVTCQFHICFRDLLFFLHESVLTTEDHLEALSIKVDFETSSTH